MLLLSKELLKWQAHQRLKSGAKERDDVILRLNRQSCELADPLSTSFAQHKLRFFNM